MAFLVPLAADVGPDRPEAVWLLLAGGLAYSVGTLCLLGEDRAARVFSHLELFHVLVIVDSVCHFWLSGGT